MTPQLAAYADVLCYRVEQPAGLAAAQAAAWQPWLDWAAARHGAVLTVTYGLARVTQPAASLAALERGLAALGVEGLAAAGLVVPALGSCVLGLAVLEGALGVADAVAVAELEALYQEARWGTDADAVARRARLVADITEAVRLASPAGG